MTLTAAEMAAAIEDIQRRTPGRDDRSQLNDSCDGPGERVIAESDLEAMADDECDREERWREGT
jgi:hypothetical protein